ncbi:hypothetical protein GCS60_000617 [Vibrio metschnikovii]|nr:hypothetical protein [Vibrio metschnikovii]
MHYLNNGSQVENVPPLKPRVGTAGYFSESNESGAPSYPGQDWFNAVIREFQTALSASGVAFDPDKFDHLSKMLTSYSQYGLGLTSPPLLGSFNSTDVVNNAIYRTDNTTTGENPTAGLSGVVRYERWGDNDFLQYFWVSTIASPQLWVRRWKQGSFSDWAGVLHTLNFAKATEAQAKDGVDDSAFMTSFLVKASYSQYGLGLTSPPLLGSFNSTDVVNNAIYRTDSTTTGANPTAGLSGVVRYERWGDNDFLQYFWVSTIASPQLWVRRWKQGSFSDWEELLTTSNEQQVGFNQSFVDETSNRMPNVAYKNISAKPILVATSIQSNGRFEVSEDGVAWKEVQTLSGVSGAPVSIIIPANYWYRSSSFFGAWTELK